MKTKLLIICSIILGTTSCADKEDLSNLTDVSATNQTLQNSVSKNCNVEYEMQFAKN